ncbi:hypothetical protein [Verrucomicrobium spinosum]|uniref:hypothetical protein n=1 Tax=Verrucomicrobium spinosum TaxID=2736 RepID=UPI0005C48261|nr:hypothetical protein [Verrucomicrobium spinosum]
MALGSEPLNISGVYPGLAMFNNEGECGTGAVVPWAGRLWAITYGPHMPYGSSDKLYEITPDLQQIVRTESIGGTPANRMIHRESNQLIVGPYFIDAERNVRVVPWQQMPGRLTGTARHLTAPGDKIYFATMEAGLYEVDVHTLEVGEIMTDRNKKVPGLEQSKADRPAPITTKLPGWHGKGLYSGQGKLVFSNNGDHGRQPQSDPDAVSGALGEWNGTGDYKLVSRNQFTEVTGPGGIYGNEHPHSDPIWATGWDKRSLILMCLDQGKWHTYRLPKASHTYDGGHGWYTEWPRIREIGEEDLLMSMHGTLWRFPKAFSPRNSAGIVPRSTLLNIVGDFCRWNDRIVFGCDVTDVNVVKEWGGASNKILRPGQSQTNLWFVDPQKLDDMGVPLGEGAVWLDDSIKAHTPSDPILFSGYAQRGLWIHHEAASPVTFTLEVDAKGDGQWTRLREIELPAKAAKQLVFEPSESGVWLRVSANIDCSSVTALMNYRNADNRSDVPSSAFDGIATPKDADVSGGLLYARGGNKRTMSFVTADALYELNGDLKLTRVEDPASAAALRKGLAVAPGALTFDAASVIYMSSTNQRWRLPRGGAAFDTASVLGDERTNRMVVTERSLFNCAGTFYELPAASAGGFGKIRPIATHNRRIKDFATYRGLLVLSGINAQAKGKHIIRSEDGKVALWAGAIDDLWQFGKPRGEGGPWKDAPVQAGVASDPYLMWGYEERELKLHHKESKPITIRIEVDPLGTGKWVTHDSVTVPPGEAGLVMRFDPLMQAHWLRVVAAENCTATAWLSYR